MSAALQLIREVEANGGQIRTEDDFLVIAPAEAAEPLMEELRQHKAEIIELLRFRSTAPVEDPINNCWGDWLRDHCIFRDRWCGAVGALYRDLAHWCNDHGRPVPASWRAFVTALKSEGFQVTSDGFVRGLILKSDLEAHERFQTTSDTMGKAVPPHSPLRSL